MDLKQHIRSIPDFPKPGILFYDIATLLAHSEAWKSTIDQLAGIIKPMQPTALAGIESRGFLVAAPLALHLGLGFFMIRKSGKLPGPTIAHEYALEYGTDTIEIQEDAVKADDRIVVLDDLLATGGTLSASIDLIHQQGAGIGAKVVGAACVVELTFLDGRQRLDVPFESLVTYDS